MGLNTTHGCFDGPYSSFNSFRYDLARQIGIDLDDYIGYSNPEATKDLKSIDHDLMALFKHSDCDGELNPSECVKIANGLDQVLKKLNTELEVNSWNFEDTIKAFRDGCRKAAELNENVIFG